MAKCKTISLREQARDDRRARKLGLQQAGPTPRVSAPATRGECHHGCRPCLYVACKYNLFLNVTRAGTIEFPFGTDVEVLYRMPATCALDVADSGGVTTHDVARLLNLTPGAAWLCEHASHKKLAEAAAALQVDLGD